jgi:hypothetical protein
LVDVNTSQTENVWDGIWFTNTFRPLIKTRNCTGFNNASDIGSGTWDPMPYETVQNMTLCICATSNCNQNLETCQQSNSGNQNIPLLPNIMSDLTTIIECANTSGNNFTCFPSIENASFIDSSKCVAYVNSHSVLCAIIDDGTDVTKQEALIEENYQSYLTGILHLLQLLSKQMSIKAPDQTDTSIYVTYPSGGQTNQECGCTQSSFCNYNISTCVQNIIQTETTYSMEFASTFATDSTMKFTSNFVTDFTMESDMPSSVMTDSSIITASVTYSTVTSKL